MQQAIHDYTRQYKCTKYKQDIFHVLNEHLAKKMKWKCIFSLCLCQSFSFPKWFVRNNLSSVSQPFQRIHFMHNCERIIFLASFKGKIYLKVFRGFKTRALFSHVRILCGFRNPVKILHIQGILIYFPCSKSYDFDLPYKDLKSHSHHFVSSQQFQSSKGYLYLLNSIWKPFFSRSDVIDFSTLSVQI